MGLKEQISGMKDLLLHMSSDLRKAETGNRAASQRGRTGSLKFSKIAKLYRKESIAAEKRMGSKRAHIKKKRPKTKFKKK